MNTKRSLPEIPDDDKDFTPDLARKIIAAYQAMILISDDSDLGDAHADLVTQYCIDKTGKPDNRGKWKARTEAAEASNKVLIEALTTKQCPKCKGTKGFYDTTYDRTGAWENCHTCDGTGRVFDMKALRKAAVLAGDKGNKG